MPSNPHGDTIRIQSHPNRNDLSGKHPTLNWMGCQAFFLQASRQTKRLNVARVQHRDGIDVGLSHGCHNFPQSAWSFASLRRAFPKLYALALRHGGSELHPLLRDSDTHRHVYREWPINTKLLSRTSPLCLTSTETSKRGGFDRHLSAVRQRTSSSDQMCAGHAFSPRPPHRKSGRRTIRRQLL